MFATNKMFLTADMHFTSYNIFGAFVNNIRKSATIRFSMPVYLFTYNKPKIAEDDFYET